MEGIPIYISMLIILCVLIVGILVIPTVLNDCSSIENNGDIDSELSIGLTEQCETDKAPLTNNIYSLSMILLIVLAAAVVLVVVRMLD